MKVEIRNQEYQTGNNKGGDEKENRGILGLSSIIALQDGAFRLPLSTLTQVEETAKS
jgi:hypothetical protein